MLYRTSLAWLACFAALASALDIFSSSSDEAADSPVEAEFLAVASFPESNPFGHVINGESNAMEVAIENNSGKNVTLLNIGGSFHNSASSALIKPTNNITFGILLPDGVKVTIPYQFYSELKTGEVHLLVELEHITDGKRYRMPVFDSNVTVVEPELSIFDFKLLSTYAMVFALLGGLGYFAYLTFVPQPKKVRKPAPQAPEVGPAAGSTTGYQEEWIPEHHLKKSKKHTGVVSSGDELSGGETSGAEVKKRKGRK